MVNQYTLQDTMDIAFNGFDIQLPDSTIKLIEGLTSQVGSPTYIKTPNFQKKEISNDQFKKKRRVGGTEIVKDNDWENLRTFHATKIEQKVGLDVEIDIIRTYLNKMSDKNYNDMKDNIVKILDKLIEEDISDENMLRVSNIIFDIASTNRFFSKLYADLYSVLMNKYEIMQEIFENNFEKFMELFSIIENIDPEKNYDAFCRVNKNNEIRKSLSAFFVNLCNIKVLSIDKIINLLNVMLSQVMIMINQKDKKSEVDEFTENIAILYDNSLLTQIHSSTILIEGGITIKETIEKLATCKSKDYSSLSSKAIFKYMDLIERNL